MGMKSIMFMCVPLMIALVFMAGDADEEYYSCSTDLYPCYDYLDSNNTPADACCSSMKEATANQFLCLCSLSSSNPNLYWMNFTQARSLRSRCDLEDLSPSNCKDMDTLRHGEKLRSPNYLVSAAQVFALGFFIPQGSMESYLATWYTDYPTKIVWIANRDKAIESYSGFLTIDETGSFLIDGINPYNVSPRSELPSHITRSNSAILNPPCPAVNRGHLEVELYPGTTTANSNLSATLLDNGNLVLRVVNSDGSQGRILWQSFDYPTDTLLPAMRLGFNYTTRRNVSLTSWLAENNPSAGLFTMEWDTLASQLVVRRQGVIIWTSGKLKNQSFDYINGSALQNYTLMSDRNADAKFFSYTLNNNLTKNSEWQILYNGTLAFSEDERRYVIPIEERCYGYNTNGGCVNWTQPPCRNDKTTFEFWSGSFILPNGNVDEGIDEKNESLGPSDCRVICWNNCSCVGYSKTNDSGHCTWYMGTGLQFEQDLSGSTPAKYVIIRKSSPNENKGREQNAGRIKWMWLAVTIPIILLLTFMAIIIYLKKNHKGRGRKEEDILQLMTSDGISNLPELEHGNSLDQNLKVFSLVSLIEATNNFSPESKLGEGGYGPVYKGILPEKLEIAVKRLSKSSGQGLVEFKNELILIARLQHMNLVRLLGCCIHREEKMLVYEYMPNKSLDSFLFDASKRGLLEWRKRVMIIGGIAQGLLYLHQHSRLRIIHRDLKASNILLDADMNPKISDFGMARIFSHNDLMANTHRIVGTYGYMSPEYALQGIFSVKSDIFSFGVLMLEILSGQKNNSFHDMNGPQSLVQYAWELWQEDRGLELMDPVLKDSSSTQEFLRFLHLGLLCVEDSPVDRPTSSEVISMITNQSIALSSVKKPAYLNLNSVINNDYERNEVEYHSVNVVSISTVSGR